MRPSAPEAPLATSAISVIKIKDERNKELWDVKYNKYNSDTEKAKVKIFTTSSVNGVVWI